MTKIYENENDLKIVLKIQIKTKQSYSNVKKIY